MRAIHRGLVAIGAFGLVAAGAVGAEAGVTTLVTAPANSTFGDSDTVFCQVVNIGKKPLPITITTRNVSGVVVSTKDVTIAPGAVDGLQEGGTSQYCRFDVSGSKKNVRAQAIYYNTPGQHLLLTVPAQ